MGKAKETPRDLSLHITYGGYVESRSVRQMYHRDLRGWLNACCAGWHACVYTFKDDGRSGTMYSEIHGPNRTKDF